MKDRINTVRQTWSSLWVSDENYFRSLHSVCKFSTIKLQNKIWRKFLNSKNKSFDWMTVYQSSIPSLLLRPETSRREVVWSTSSKTFVFWLQEPSSNFIFYQSSLEVLYTKVQFLVCYCDRKHQGEKWYKVLRNFCVSTSRTFFKFHFEV